MREGALTQRPDSIRVLLADRHALFREAMRAVLESEAEFAEMRSHGPKIRSDVEALIAELRAG